MGDPPSRAPARGEQLSSNEATRRPAHLLLTPLMSDSLLIPRGACRFEGENMVNYVNMLQVLNVCIKMEVFIPNKIKREVWVYPI